MVLLWGEKMTGSPPLPAIDTTAFYIDPGKFSRDEHVQHVLTSEIPNNFRNLDISGKGLESE